MPEAVRKENGLEVVGKMEDASIHGRPGNVRCHAKLSEC
jgi:hypothetical protein